MDPTSSTDATADAPAPGADGQARRSRLPFVLGGAALLGIVAFLAIGVFGVHTLFFDEEVAEEGPTFASGAAAEAAPTTAPEVVPPPPREPTTPARPRRRRLRRRPPPPSPRS